MNINAKENKYFTGRFSDGSDREEHINFEVTVTDSEKVYFKVCDVVPTEIDIDISIFEDITPAKVPTIEELAAGQEEIKQGMMDIFVAIYEIQGVV